MLQETPRADLRNACLMTLAHIRAIGLQDDLLPYLCVDESRWTAIYVAGITHHPQLSTPGGGQSGRPVVAGRGAGLLVVTGSDHRFQMYGVVVVTRRRPERSRIGRENAVESELISRFPARSAAWARLAVSAR